MTNNSSYYLTPILGGLAGVIADVVTHPVATVKTRLQVQGVSKRLGNTVLSSTVQTYDSIFTASKMMLFNEGFSSFFKGIGAVIYGAPIASGLYFGGIELSNKLFDKIYSNNMLTDFISGTIGQLCGSLAWVPMDVIKERCQIEGQIKTNISYKSSVIAFNGIIKSEGILGLYRAYFIHQFTWAPFNGIYWSIYNKSKYLFKENYNMSNNYNFIISSTIAGCISSFVTSPLDLVKTRMQVQRSNPNLFNFNNPLQCSILVFKNEGLFAFFDGVMARILWLTPRYIVAVSLFDYLKTNYIISNNHFTFNENNKIVE